MGGSLAVLVSPATESIRTTTTRLEGLLASWHLSRSVPTRFLSMVSGYHTRNSQSTPPTRDDLQFIWSVRFSEGYCELPSTDRQTVSHRKMTDCLPADRGRR